MKVQLSSHTSENQQQSKQAMLGLYLAVDGLEECAVTSIPFSLMAQESTSGSPRLVSREGTYGFCAAAKSVGVRDLCSIGAFSSWGSLDTKLRAKYLVHSDECLYLKTVIKEIE